MNHFVIQCLLYIKKNVNNFKLNSDFHSHNTRYRKYFIHKLCNYYSRPLQMNFEFMALKLNPHKLTKNLDYCPFKSLIERKLYGHPIYTIKEYFDIVHSFI